MKPLDRLLESWRFAKAAPYIAQGSRVLDIGCGRGALFRRLARRIAGGVGIDPDPDPAAGTDRVRIIRGRFPVDLPSDSGPFDAITMLACLEHLPPAQHAGLAARCAALLRPGGVLVITVPSPAVDRIIHVLQRVPFLFDGTHTEEHYGFEPSSTPAIFASFEPVAARTFQFGLNNLFVFRKPLRPS
jgi:2-polyprenyl-3-methyl-5-hydroxy-6-metoxy-1,4-benzoquinol methylase